MKRVLILSILIGLAGCSQDRPTNLGIKKMNDKSKLLACPDKPNCVISNQEGAVREGQYLEPFQGSGSKEHDMERILKILKKNSAVEVISQSEDYIHAVFTSSIFRFKDDVEFYFEDGKKVHFRSASRVGHSDLGANKKRIEKIRFEFQQS